MQNYVFLSGCKDATAKSFFSAAEDRGQRTEDICSCIGKRAVLVLCLLLGMLFVSGCSQEETADEPVRIVYVDWASERASSNLLKAVIEDRLHRECQLLDVSLNAMWQALAAGDQDASVAAWLPSLQAEFLNEHQDQVQKLGLNLEGTRIGLVVPEYVDIESIEELQEHQDKFESRIVGIEPGAGVMAKTEQAIAEYGLRQLDLVSGSGPTMARALEQAIAEERWIVVTGWTPHWKFAKWDLKYLQDPENVYGEDEYIGTVVRQGLQDDMPEVYEFLKNFQWQPEDMEQVMYWTREEGTDYLQAARRWIQENEETVDSWLEQ